MFKRVNDLLAGSAFYYDIYVLVLIALSPKSVAVAVTINGGFLFPPSLGRFGASLSQRTTPIVFIGYIFIACITAINHRVNEKCGDAENANMHFAHSRTTLVMFLSVECV